ALGAGPSRRRVPSPLPPVREGGPSHGRSGRPGPRASRGGARVGHRAGGVAGDRSLPGLRLAPYPRPSAGGTFPHASHGGLILSTAPGNHGRRYLPPCFAWGTDPFNGPREP